METVKLSEFDVFTREDLISEITAMRGKYKEEVAASVLKNTEKERERLLEVENEYVSATHDYVSKELADLIELYERSKANEREQSGRYYHAYSHLYEMPIRLCISSMKRTIEKYGPTKPMPDNSAFEDFTKRSKDETARLGFIESIIDIFRITKRKD